MGAENYISKIKVVATTTTRSSSNARAFQIVSVTQASTTITEDEPFQNQTDVGPNGTTLPPTTTLDQSSTNVVFAENVTTEDPRLEKMTSPSDMTQAPTSSTTKSSQSLASSTVAANPNGTSETENLYNNR